MNETIKGILANEKIGVFFKKIFNKKTFKIAIVAIVLAAVLKVGFAVIFEVNGVVQKVEGSKITVANFFITQTTDIGQERLTTAPINVGDRIKIMKNLSGQVLFVRSGHGERGGNRGERAFMNKGNGSKNKKGEPGQNQVRQNGQNQGGQRQRKGNQE